MITMGEQFASMDDLKELRAEMKEGFAKMEAAIEILTKSVASLQRAFETSQVTTLADADRRYRVRTELIDDAMKVLDDERFICKAKPIIKQIIVEHAAETRDNIIKWGNFFRFIGVILAASIAYAFMTNQMQILTLLKSIPAIH